jgi:hypothetical protein
MPPSNSALKTMGSPASRCRIARLVGASHPHSRSAPVTLAHVADPRAYASIVRTMPGSRIFLRLGNRVIDERVPDPDFCCNFVRLGLSSQVVESSSGPMRTRSPDAYRGRIGKGEHHALAHRNAGVRRTCLSTAIDGTAAMKNGMHATIALYNTRSPVYCSRRETSAGRSLKARRRARCYPASWTWSSRSERSMDAAESFAQAVDRARTPRQLDAAVRPRRRTQRQENHVGFELPQAGPDDGCP